MKVAIVHYWLKGMRGGEKVVERLCRLYPQADLFTHVYRADRVSETLRCHRVEETYIGRLPFAARLCESVYLPLAPGALTGLDLGAYDLVISSESAPAKGVITRPDALHLCYCHSPMRYVWDHLHFYRRHSGVLGRLGLDLFGPGLRRWDMLSAGLVDVFVANSRHTAKRIAKVYRREARVIPPPVEMAGPAGPAPRLPGPEAPYLFVGALTPYKRADLAVEAFRLLGPEHRLEIVGDGEHAAGLRRHAPPNVTLRGWLDDAALAEAYRGARALVFPGEEDFGIVPVEAMAAGLPVIAYRAGGALDTVVDGETGLFFDDATSEALAAAVRRLEASAAAFEPARISEHAARFSPDRFDAAILQVVEEGLAAVRGAGPPAPLSRAALR